MGGHESESGIVPGNRHRNLLRRARLMRAKMKEAHKIVKRLPEFLPHFRVGVDEHLVEGVLIGLLG